MNKVNIAEKFALWLLAAIGILFAPLAVSAQAGAYFPLSDDYWEQRRPEALSMDGARLAKAFAFAQAQETDFPHDFSTQEKIFGRSKLCTDTGTLSLA